VGTLAAHAGSMSNFHSITLAQLDCVTGGADTQAAPAPAPAPTQPAPQGGSDTQWIRNTVNCTRIGGPVLGAICGALTPTPAY
jgi:hypothetical protein